MALTLSYAWQKLTANLQPPAGANCYLSPNGNSDCVFAWTGATNIVAVLNKSTLAMSGLGTMPSGIGLGNAAFSVVSGGHILGTASNVPIMWTSVLDGSGSYRIWLKNIYANAGNHYYPDNNGYLPGLGWGAIVYDPRTPNLALIPQQSGTSTNCWFAAFDIPSLSIMYQYYFNQFSYWTYNLRGYGIGNKAAGTPVNYYPPLTIPYTPPGQTGVALVSKITDFVLDDQQTNGLAAFYTSQQPYLNSTAINLGVATFGKYKGPTQGHALTGGDLLSVQLVLAGGIGNATRGPNSFAYTSGASTNVTYWPFFNGGFSAPLVVPKPTAANFTGNNPAGQGNVMFSMVGDIPLAWNTANGDIWVLSLTGKDYSLLPTLNYSFRR